MATAKLDMEKLVSLCRRRGFIFQSSEIYGGINGFWDYGPMGVELKKNIKDAWWQDMVRNPPAGPDGQEIAMVGLDCSIIMNPKVWEASGHVGGVADPMVDCVTCRRRFRGDKVYFLRFTESPIQNLTIGGVEADNRVDAEALFAERMAKHLKKRDLGPDILDHYQKKRFVILSAIEVFQADKPESNLLFRSLEPRTSGMCPAPGCDGDLTAPRAFNLMFQTYVGAIQSDENIAYLRPETAQGIFANFKNVLDSSRVKLPFGIAQIGKAFRNEINPRNFTFRAREFEQMEIEFFCHPDESRRWYEYWRETRKEWYTKLGIRSERLRPREQEKDELAHYSVGTTDIEYLFPFSDEPQELEGVAHRGAFDLSAHMQHSGKELTYFDEDGWNALLQGRLEQFKEDKKRREEEKKKLDQEERPKFVFTPHVIEPSAGADRLALAVLCEAYSEDEAPDASGKLEKRVVLRFHPRLAPIKAAVFPHMNKDGMPEKADALYRELKKHFKVAYDDGGQIGRRYRRQDEIGTPFCITIDGDTLKDDTVTIRDRDTLQQRRVPIGGVLDEIRKALE